MLNMKTGPTLSVDPALWYNETQTQIIEITPSVKMELQMDDLVLPTTKARI